LVLLLVVEVMPLKPPYFDTHLLIGVLLLLLTTRLLLLLLLLLTTTHYRYSLTLTTDWLPAPTTSPYCSLLLRSRYYSLPILAPSLLLLLLLACWVLAWWWCC